MENDRRDKETTVQQLSQAWLDAKAAEDAARTQRVGIEEAIIARLGSREEGAQTHDLGDFKATITGVVNRTLDKQTWESIKERIPTDLRPVKYEPKLDVVGVKWLRDNNPSIYKLVAKAITVKPGKTSVKVIPVNKS